MHETNKLRQALRTTDSNGTADFLKHRNALRKCLVRIIADIDNSEWTMDDDHILDRVEHWLRDRMSSPARSTFAALPVEDDFEGLPKASFAIGEGA